jgi:3'5'-cyclic nucleotide phosphodiesterase
MEDMNLLENMPIET